MDTLQDTFKQALHDTSQQTWYKHGTKKDPRKVWGR